MIKLVRCFFSWPLAVCNEKNIICLLASIYAYCKCKFYVQCAIPMDRNHINIQWINSIKKPKTGILMILWLETRIIQRKTDRLKMGSFVFMTVPCHTCDNTYMIMSCSFVFMTVPYHTCDNTYMMVSCSFVFMTVPYHTCDNTYMMLSCSVMLMTVPYHTCDNTYIKLVR